MLTPSSNTVLEPATTAMLAGVPGVTAHFGRFKVTEIALTDRALGQFDESGILRAAELLADARVDAIAWNGTSASWLGFDRDERLCERIQGRHGDPGLHLGPRLPGRVPGDGRRPGRAGHALSR
jgi:maleate isomerase